MKELDKSRVYDLSELTSEERKELLNYLKQNFNNWKNSVDFYKNYQLYFDDYENTWYQGIGVIESAHNAKELFEPTIPTLEEFTEKCETANELLKSYEEKPIQYQIGIDAIGIAEKNMTIDECLAIARFNITKYSYRKKNQDLEDFKKVIAYANWAIKLLNKK